MRIVIFDQLGSFSKQIAAEWEKQGHSVTCHKQFDGAALIGAEFCFVDWADQNAIAATRERLPIPLAIRLHSYEVFTHYPAQIKWWNCDKLIFVAGHVRDYALNAFNPACPSVVIPNAVTLEDWAFKKRDRVAAPKVAFTGGFDSKKGTVLLQQIFAVWPKATFHICGPQHDTRYTVSMLDFLHKSGFRDRVSYDGYQQNLDKWLDDKDFILLTSPWEGHNVGLIQAMAKGIKPLVYNFPGAEEQYPAECLWLTLRELKQKADEPYRSERYRDWLVKKDWIIEAQILALNNILANPKEKTVEDVRTYYDYFLPYLEEDLRRPNPRHQKIFEFIRQNIGKEDRVADLGCGIGITTNEIAKHSDFVVGYDFSEKLIEKARQLFPQVKFRVAEIPKEFSHGVDVTDTACVFDCLEHLTKKQREDLYWIFGQDEELYRFDKILITLPVNQRKSGLPMQMVDEEIGFDEIWKALPHHYCSVSQKYGIDYPDQYLFLRFDKIKTAPEKEEVLDAQES